MDLQDRPTKPPDSQCACGKAIAPLWIGVSGKTWHVPEVCPECHEANERARRYKELVRYLISKAGFSKCHENMTLENYQPSTPSQREALKRVNGYDISQRRNIILHGSVGVGKSHLVVGLAKKLIQAWTIPIWFISILDLLAKIKATFGDYPVATTQDVLSALSNEPILIIDDLARESDNNLPWVREQLFYIIDNRIKRELPTLVTTNLAPSDLAVRYEEPIISRLFQGALILRIEGKDYRLEGEK